MPLEITYVAARGDDIPVLGGIISCEQRTVSGSSAQSGATPADAKLILIEAVTDKVRIAYGANPTAVDNGTFHYIPAGKDRWLTAVPGWKIAGIVAA